MKKKRDKKDKITELWQFHQAIGRVFVWKRAEKGEGAFYPKRGVL